jgi:hypothetical protein
MGEQITVDLVRTREEIREIVLQTCIYAGVPSAGEAFKIARQVFAEPNFAAWGEPAPKEDDR